MEGFDGFPREILLTQHTGKTRKELVVATFDFIDKQYGFFSPFGPGW